MKMNIIIIGAKGYGQNYGGWETFVTNLINNYQDKDTNFFVPNLTHDKSKHHNITIKNNVECVDIYCRKTGFVTMFVFTIKATLYYLKQVKKNKLTNTLFLNLGSKVGPLYLFWKPILKRRNIKTVINPDGLEWKREKWAWWIKICFKISEWFYMKFSDYVVCDSKAIQKYIDEKYKSFKIPSKYIAFGAYLDELKTSVTVQQEILSKLELKANDYYLMVGRFVPENNYELIIKEFMKSNTTKKLAIISNIEHNKFYCRLLENTKFDQDKRVILVGPVYDQEKLKTIRTNAYGYLHGHSAGGTNPSLLESLSNTKLNLVYDVDYNREVCLNSAMYFSKEENSLCNLIDNADRLSPNEINEYGKKAVKRIEQDYTWELIVNKYQELFELLLK